jgi:hypothetical protein
MSTISASTTTTNAYVVTADTTGTLVLQTGATPTTAVTINGSQNVGIGNTPSGTYKLEVSGLISGSGFSAVGNATLNRATATAYNVAGGVQFQVDGTSYCAIAQPAAQVLAFYTGNATTERMRIDSSGNVGIGTASPGALLHVSNVAAKVRIGSTAGSEYVDISRDSASGVIVYNAAQASFGAHVWQIAGTERARIDPSGNLLVGTTTASGKIATFVGPGQVGYYTNKSSAGGGLDHAQYYTDGGLQGKITQTGGFTTVSDYRIKSDVTPLTGMLDKVCKLKPVSYTLTAFDQQQFGFIAHELQEELPVFVDGEKDAVNEDGSIAPQSVDYPKIVSVLTAAIQELKALADTQASTITTLTDRIAVLENK